MELTKKGRLYLAVVSGIIVVAIGVTYLILNKPQNANESPKEIIKTDTPTSFKGELPYAGDGFSIEYLVQSDQYVINIYETPVEEKKEIALKYLSKNGLDTSRANISFFLGPDVSEHSGP